MGHGLPVLYYTLYYRLTQWVTVYLFKTRSSTEHHFSDNHDSNSKDKLALTKAQDDMIAELEASVASGHKASLCDNFDHDGR